MIVAVIKSSLILLTAFGIVLMLRRQSAAVRHLIWTAGLIAALAVPLLSPLLPSWHAPIAGNPQTGGLTSDFFIVVMPEVASSPDAPPRRSANLMSIIWWSGTAIAGIWFLAGGVKLRRLVLRGKPLNSSRWLAAATEVSRQLKLNRPIRLLQNDGLSTLGTWGIFSARILLPRDAETWSDERMRVVLSHELAHVKRFDWLVQILAEAARAIYWFNPLFWIACRQLRRESEHACDDAVLNLGIAGQTYAAHLLELARALKNSDRAWSPVLAMAQPPHLERRFVAMLNPSLNHRPATRAIRLLVAISALSLTLPLAAMRSPEQISQSVPLPPVVATAVVPAPAAAPEAKPRVTAPATTRRTAPAARKPVQGLADGSLTGTVYDASGAVIPGVRLTVSTLEIVDNLGLRETPVQSVVSDETGTFGVRALAEGSYSLKADLPGFVSFRRAGLQIKPSQTLTENVTLSVGGVQERVTVTATGQPRPLPPAGTPRRIRVGGNVQAANLISQVRPIYPPGAQSAGIEGTVRLQGIIGGDGSMLALSVLGSNDPDLTNAALEAVRQWRYRPVRLNGIPVEIVTTIDVDFKLAQ